MKNLHTVYDFRNESIFHWPVYLFLFLTASTLFIFLLMRKNSYSYYILLRIKSSSLWGFVFACVILLIITANELKSHYQIKRIFDNKQYAIVEGKVQEYHPMPAGGHDSETFRVGDLYFTMCDYDLGILGYNNAASHGGVIKPNLYVRILYPTYGRIAILRLETE